MHLYRTARCQFAHYLPIPRRIQVTHHAQVCFGATFTFMDDSLFTRHAADPHRMEPASNLDHRYSQSHDSEGSAQSLHWEAGHGHSLHWESHHNNDHLQLNHILSQESSSLPDHPLTIEKESLSKMETCPPTSWRAPSGDLIMGNEMKRALFAEFMASALFALFGSNASSGALGNGFLLAVLIYIVADSSGGHINPAVSFALAVSNQITWGKAICYSVVQLLGATFGTLFSAWMSPDMQDFSGGKIGCLGTGVFNPMPNIGPFQIFFWEFGMTFVLASTVLACCVNEPGWGNISPFIIGLSIFATVTAGGQFTGGAVNPARFFSVSFVYGCSLDLLPHYWLGEFLGGMVAGWVQHRVINN